MKFLRPLMFASLAALPLAISPTIAATTDGTTTSMNPQTGATTTTMPNGASATVMPNGAPVTRDGKTYTQTGTAVTPTTAAPGAAAAGSGGSGK